jgi:mannosyltransferase OCH1-like enzyme
MENIPKNIFFYWTGSEIPNNLMLNVNNFKNKNKDFTVKIFDKDDVILELAKQDFPTIALLFNFITIPTCKSDIMRLLLLYYYGGIYVDCNTIPNESFNIFYQQNKHMDFIISFNYNNNDYSTRILFSKPKILLLNKVLQKIQENLLDLYNKEQNSNELIPYNILVLTGTYPFYTILGRNNCKKEFDNITYFDDNSNTVSHYGCKLKHHINFNLHWSNLQKVQKLFKQVI